MNTIQEIKDAVTSGKTVHWSNKGYIVLCDTLGQWFIKFTPNGHCTGLTDDYNPKDFFTA